MQFGVQYVNKDTETCWLEEPGIEQLAFQSVGDPVFNTSFKHFVTGFVLKGA